MHTCIQGFAAKDILLECPVWHGCPPGFQTGKRIGTRASTCACAGFYQLWLVVVLRLCMRTKLHVLCWQWQFLKNLSEQPCFCAAHCFSMHLVLFVVGCCVWFVSVVSNIVWFPFSTSSFEHAHQTLHVCCLLGLVVVLRVVL